MSDHFLQPLLHRTTGSPVLVNTRNNLTVATVLEGAFDSADRRKGLLGRQALPQGHALIIAPTNLVHTYRMRFNIDIIFAARSGRVVKVRHDVPRGRIAGAWGGFAVIELAAGEASRADVQQNDVLQLLAVT
jgi:uncharacterized membrane protein (UPF0127 family)